MQTIIVPADNSSSVGEVRRIAMKVAREEGLDETLTSHLGIVATELSTNLLKHARRGEIQIASLFERGEQGVEILSVDCGPGFGNLSSVLTDGYSTAGTAGTGLGAVLRLSTEFDAYSEPGRGTVIVARLSLGPAKDLPRSSMVVGVVSKAVGTEPVCGDSWAVSFTETGCLLCLADGLGHGVDAAKASGEAVSVFLQSDESSPVPLLQKIHAALRGTRGAAVSVASVSPIDEVVQFAGIGNVAGRVVGWKVARHMVSHVGTAGFEARRFQEFTYPFPPSTAVVMHSDGLTSSWNLDDYPGLVARDPSLIAAVLYRDTSRGRDDVCVVVAKRREAS